MAAAAAVLDQLSKFALQRYFDEPGCAVHEQTLTSYLKLVLTCNSGVSFGMLSGAGVNSLIFALVAALVVIALTVWLVRAHSVVLAVGIGLVIGGAIGNVVDRLRFGGVIDFLYFHAGSWYWPAFNLADSAICVGVAAMLLDGMLVRRQKP
ncbi:MAG TPA: signal peptidase II [Stellaceae bacterium]|nr:signal peptidase II [Stellaceae bacterium]